MPAIGKILIVFVLMLAVTRLRVHLGLALVLGGVALDLWAGLPAAQTLAELGKALISGETWLFIVIMALIIEISCFMTDQKNADEIITAVKRWGGHHGRTWMMISLPAVIGLIPMPAGALFSAPFVKQAGEKVEGEEDWKSSVNYWFRHVWEYWWPLYPGVIIAMSVFSMVESWQYVAVQIPYTAVAFGAGYLFLIRSRQDSLKDVSEGAAGNNRRAAFLFLPILIVVASLFLFPFPIAKVFPGVDGEQKKLLSLLAGLIIGLALIFWDGIRAERRSGGPGRRMFSTLFKGPSLNVQFSLIGVLVFTRLLKVSGLVPEAGRELAGSGIPLAVAVAALPFLAGMVTGIALGFTGTSFPLVVELMNTPGSGLPPLSTLVLAYGFGYIGMMYSPVHLCLLVTRDYFTASLVGIGRHILPCALAILAYSLLAHLALRWLGW